MTAEAAMLPERQTGENLRALRRLRSKWVHGIDVGKRRSEVFNRVAACTATKCPPDADGDIVRNEPRAAIAHRGLHAAAVPAAGSHHRGRRGGGQQTWWIERIVGIALAA